MNNTWDENSRSCSYKCKWDQCRIHTGYAAIKAALYVSMHRFLTKCPDGYMVDHINGNSLDNRRTNLRTVTNRENQQNRTVHREGRLCGCTYRKRIKKWEAQIRINKSQKHLGYFKTEIEAHQAYMKAHNDHAKKEKSAA